MAQEQKQVTLLAPETLPFLMLDARLIHRVLTNLVSNAIKHTPPGTAITLGFGISPEGVQLWVHDTGPGSPAEQLDRLFERLGASPSTSSAQSNTG